MCAVDLFLGGPLGMWVLDNVRSSDVGFVNSPEPGIVKRALAVGIPAAVGDANCVDYDTARVGLSMHYPVILKPHLLAKYDRVYNIHPALLPWGRCYYPVFWALWAGEPAGATLHVIDEGIDSGPVVAQVPVSVYDYDTGGSLHRRVSEAEKALFLEWWPRIVAGEDIPVTPQPQGGSFHYKREFFELKSPSSKQLSSMTADDLLKLVRCLSHESYSGMIVEVGERWYSVKMSPDGW